MIRIMSGTLAFADEGLEAGFKHHLFLKQRAYCRGYHRINATMSAIAFGGLLYEWSAGALVSKLLVQAAIVILCSTALHFINTQPTMFSGIFQPWHIFQRICVCVRCCDIRSVWFTVPNQRAFLQPAFTLQFFFGTLLLPTILQCFGLPLPAGLDALSAAAMLLTILVSNSTFCTALGKQDESSMLCAAQAIEEYIAALWDRNGRHVPPTDHQYHTVMCQAKLGFMQAATLCATVVVGFVLEIYRRRQFLAKRYPPVAGALKWPLRSRRIMTGIAFDIVLIIAGFSSLCQMYMWYIAQR
jgi:hypothetical protein